jgi:hypothetical protein
MAKRVAYRSTAVPVSRTQEVIRKLFQRYSVLGCQFTDNFETGEIVLRFVRRVNDIPRTVQIKLSAEGNERQAYRQLYYWIKSQLEAVDFGLLKFESAFLAHFEWMLEDGTMVTIGELVAPRLAEQGHGRLLAAPKEPEEADWTVVEGDGV